MIVVDIESLSLADLKKVGHVNYANDPSTFISVLSWSKLDEDKTYSIVHPKLSTKRPPWETIMAFHEFLSYKGKLIAHNAPFEKAVFNAKLADFVLDTVLNTVDPQYPYKASKFVDTMTLSNMYRGPASLAKATRFFDLKEVKDTDAQKLMKTVCRGRAEKPRSLKTTALRRPAQWIEINGNWFKTSNEIYSIIEKYCRTDVESTKDLYKKLSSAKKLKDFGHFSSEIITGLKMARDMNERGVLVDKVWLDKLAKHKEHIDELAVKHSLKAFGLLPTKNIAIKKHIEETTDYKIAGMGKPDIIKSFRENKGHEELKENLKTYMELNKRSLKKIDTARNTMSEDCVLTDMFKYCGAATTGRFSSFGVQLQNLPRPKKGFTLEECEKMIYSDEKVDDGEKLTSALRGSFIPRPGKKFFIADLSQIELRRVLHKAGYLDKLSYLATGKGDLYADLASKMLKKKVTKADEERQVGKAFLLALGYGMGVLKFINSFEASIGKKINENTARQYIQAYKNEYAKVVHFWEQYQNAMFNAYQKKQEFRVKLASGRYLNYGKLVKRRFTTPEGTKENICYFNGNNYVNLYGSMIFQHVIQAECRDILLIKMNALYTAGAKIVMTIHDEVVVEVPENAELDTLKKAWYNAGSDKIEELFPGMIVDSDCVFTDRYWSH